MNRCQTCNIITTDEHKFCPNDGQPLVEDEVASKLQEALGEKYTLTQLIGKGAMGAVYRARHRDLDDVAIKVMLGQSENQQLSERFVREAKALRKMRHQHAVTVYDLDRSTPGLTYMVMEMIEGGSLREDLRERGRLTLQETMDVAEAVSSALQAAHERGIIHRDLKPDNILMAEEKTITGTILRNIKIADFGIVKLRANPQAGEADPIKLTQFGTPIGTPFYMSPEQWFGEGAGINALDGRTDIYALGCTLYEMLSGRTPFMGRTTSEVRRQHLEQPPAPLHQVVPDVPESVSGVIMRALEKDRDDRQRTAAEFASDLRRAFNESQSVALAPTGDLLEKQPRQDGEEKEALPDRAQPAEAAKDDGDVVQPGVGATPAPEAQAVEAPVSEQKEAPREEDAMVAAPPAGEDARAEEMSQPVAGQSPEASIVAYDAQTSAMRAADTQQDVDLSDPEATQVRNIKDILQDVEAEKAAPSVDKSDQAKAALNLPPASGQRMPLWVRLSLLTLIVLITGLVALAGIYFYRYYKTTPQVTSTEKTDTTPVQPSIADTMSKGTLRISAPAGSEVFIDDEKAGTVGAEGELSTEAVAGQRNVRVTSGDNRPWIREIKVKAGSTTPVKAKPQRTPDSKEATAEIEASELLKANQNDAAAQAKLAESLYAQKRYGEAISAYEAAIRIKPDDVDMLTSLGQLYEIKRRDGDAKTTYRQAIKVKPNDPSVHALLAWVLQRNPGTLNDALTEIDAALKVVNDPDFLDTKAHILLGLDKFEEAKGTAQSAIDKDGAPAFKASMAAILYRMGQTDEAVTLYKQVRQSDRSTDLWGDLKRLEMLRGYSEKTLKDFVELIKRTN